MAAAVKCQLDRIMKVPISENDAPRRALYAHFWLKFASFGFDDLKIPSSEAARFRLTMPPVISNFGGQLTIPTGRNCYTEYHRQIMKTSNDLFQLIKSLSSQEKRYFKLFASYYSRSSANNYTKLFDAIDKMDEYDETLLQEATRHESFARHLPTIKYQLTKLTLDSLAAFHRGKSVGAELRDLIAHIEILYRKGLYDHCGKVIARAKKKAQQFERFAYLIEILAWERRLHFKDVADDLEHELDDYYRKSKGAIKNVYTSTLYLELIDQVQSACRRYARLRTAEDRAELDRIIASHLIQNESKATTFAARVARLSTLGFYEWIVGNFEQARTYQSQAIALWEANELQIRDNPEWYKWFLSNYLNYCIALKQFDDFKATVRKIKSLPSVSLQAAINVFESVTYLELFYCLNAGDLEEGLRSAHDIEKGIAVMGDRIRPNRLITMHHNCSILYFLCARYDQSLLHINAILNHGLGELKRDIQEFARIFRLLIHFELGNFDDLEHLFRSAYRFLSKRHSSFEFEKIVLSSVKKLLNCPDRPSALPVFEKFRSELIAVLRSSASKEPVGLMELLIWVDSKITQRPINEVYIATLQQGRFLSKVELFPLP